MKKNYPKSPARQLSWTAATAMLFFATILVAGTLPFQSSAQTPTVSYSGPHTYTQGVAIAALSPASTLVSAPAYSGSPITIGSGFSTPTGVAVDAAGNVYVADNGNNAVKKIPAGGGSPISIGSGFSSPFGVAVDAAGNVYVADGGVNGIKKIPAGGGSTVTVVGPFSGNSPFGVAVDAAANLYLAYGAVYEVLAGSNVPAIIGSGSIAAYGVAIDAAGNVYVADRSYGSIRKIPAGGGAVVNLGSGFSGPEGVAIDAAGNIFVADQLNNAVKEIPAGSNTPIVIGSGFLHPTGVAVDGAGNVYVADNGNNAVKVIKPLGGFYITPFLPAGLTINTTTGAISGTPTAVSPATNYTVTAYNASGLSKSASVGITVNAAPVPTLSYNGPQTFTRLVAAAPLLPASTRVASPAYSYSPLVIASGFNSPLGVAADTAGNVYVADRYNNVVKKIPAGGAPVNVGSGFSEPAAVAVDVAGSVYVASFFSGVQKIPVGGGPVITLNSSNGPDGIAVDAGGNIYFSIYASPSNVYKLPSGGGALVSIGSGFMQPWGVAADNQGNVYFAEYGTGAIKEIPAGGGSTVTLVSGLSQPTGVAVDGAGNVFFTDNGHNTVNEIPAGSSTPITLSFGFYYPSGVGLDRAGNLYVSDGGNNLLKKIKPLGGYYISPNLPKGMSFNSTTGAITGTPLVVTAAANYTITAYNSFGGSRSTVVNIKVVPNVNLASLGISSGTLAPAFATATISYKAAVTNATTSITVTPTTSDPTSTVKVNGVAVISGHASGSIPLVVGPNIITALVTAQDGVTTKSYTVTVTRAPSSNALLSAISISPATPKTLVSGPGYANYTASVANGIASVTITPTTADPTATVTVNGTAVISGKASGAIPLVVGPNTITTVVTAQNGITIKSYIITITRAPSSNALLNALSITPSTPKTVVSGPGYANYTASVANSVTSVTLTATTVDPTATVTINGTAVTSGSPSAAIALSVGGNTITTVVTAQDGVTTKSYIITLTRAPSSNALLSALSITPATPKIVVSGPGYANYTASVANAIDSVMITATTVDPTATIKVNGTTVASGSASAAIALSVGGNTITTVVTAQDGTTTKSYIITITRAPSNNALLSALNITPSTPKITVSGPGYANYTASVANAISSVTITPTTTDPTATVQVNGTAVISGAASASIPLNAGSNTITTIVTAQDGTTAKSYIITITRAPSSNALLTALSITPSTPKTVVSGPGYVNYTASVANAVTSVTITPVTQDATATVTVNGTTVASGTPSGSIALVIGSNVITTVATAQDGTTTKSYIITITRANGPIPGNTPDAAMAVANPANNTQLAEDGILVHQGISPNGDGINDFLVIDGIANYPDNRLMIMNRNGNLVYEAKRYDNNTKLFDGHSSKTGRMQLPGTYFYSLEYTVKGVTKHKTGFIVLKY